ncbi:MAG: hypothetical protein HYU97_03615 [Deltaproteobacteria bacterium]|nr:hypothetical protein [Deltaproteobacteria bacterium]
MTSNYRAYFKVFTVIDFLFALPLLLCTLMALIVPFTEEVRPDQKLAGIITLSIIIIPSFLMGISFLFGSIGLAKRRMWGYYAHIVASFIIALTCIGIVYTIFTIKFFFNPKFRAEFALSSPEPLFPIWPKN